MARIHELVDQIKALDSGLAEEISKEVKALSDRREFGLNFERHTPEQVELPGRPVRKGDKVHILAPRGETTKSENKVMWVVIAIDRDTKMATLRPHRGEAQQRDVSLDDLVVVAEFRDPIYPGLVSTGKVERGGDKPFHTVINSENFHALEALLFTHQSKVDLIYIDPPYNSGAKDWKYNNDYVEADDIYRHSKWLAFLERRLSLAKELLNPQNSTLILTIDEKEYLRIGLLLEQIFPQANIQMITSVINRFGSSRKGQFSRVEEYIYYVMIGDSTIASSPDNMLHDEGVERLEVRWKDLRRGGDDGRRAARPNLFYPIFVDTITGMIHSVGASLPADQDRNSIDVPTGTVAVFPLNPSGVEMRWGLSNETTRKYIEAGWFKWTGITQGKLQPVGFSYLGSGALKDIETGKLEVIGHDQHGSVIVEYNSSRDLRPMSVWNRTSHSAGDHGSSLLSKLLPGRKFPFPKSLYAVEDSIRFVIGDKPDAVVVDFFSGSGTTAHAVMKLNRIDGGRRISISITNNEVSADEQKALRAAGLRPGDQEWEQLGICDYITKPRLEAAITGLNPDGGPLTGEYKFSDEFPFSEGLEENAAFYTLTYETPLEVLSGRSFTRIAPLLWLRSGSKGDCIYDIPEGWAVTNSYSVILDLDKISEFIEAVSQRETVTHAFVFTEEDRLFEAVSRMLPGHIEPVRMNESYLRNAEQDALAVTR